MKRRMPERKPKGKAAAKNPTAGMIKRISKRAIAKFDFLQTLGEKEMLYIKNLGGSMALHRKRSGDNDSNFKDFLNSPSNSMVLRELNLKLQLRGKKPFAIEELRALFFSMPKG